MANDNTNPPKIAEGCAGKDASNPASGSLNADESSWEMPIFFGLTFVVLLSLLTWPWPYKLINDLWAPSQREYVGTVQKITYVGGLGPDTQIDTETRTLLLRGVVIIQKGSRLEQRKGTLHSDVCVASTDQCWHLIGS